MSDKGATKKSISKKGDAKPRAGVKKRRPQRKAEGTCFVLMPFKEPFDTYFSAIIEPAILAAHLDPLRGDSLFRPSPIMADVWQMIQDAKVLVAELTGKNANVFYELGLAHALGKPIILISETMDDVPFDLQPLRVILYDKSNPAWGADLKANLIASLEETLGDVARAVPPMFRKIVKSQAPEESALAVRLFELERRVASMVPSHPDLFTDRPPSRERNVDWKDVENWLNKPEELRTEPRGFQSRAHAVAWVASRVGRYPSSFILRKLQENLRPSEAEIVFDLAMTRESRPAGGSTHIRRGVRGGSRRVNN